jgi:hypothetical protein
MIQKSFFSRPLQCCPDARTSKWHRSDIVIPFIDLLSNRPGRIDGIDMPSYLREGHPNEVRNIHHQLALELLGKIAEWELDGLLQKWEHRNGYRPPT